MKNSSNEVKECKPPTPYREEMKTFDEQVIYKDN